VVTALNGHVVKSMRSADVVSRLSADGTEVIASSPEQFRALIKSELPRWAAVVKSSEMKAGQPGALVTAMRNLFQSTQEAS
jgi:tripartite-type tricarboxylate transporter receptor subunit TctC